MRNYKEHLVSSKTSTRQALKGLNDLGIDAILFLVDEAGRLLGSLTDGDVRRGLIDGRDIDAPVTEFSFNNPRSLTKGAYQLNDVIHLRNEGINIIPILDGNSVVINVINLRVLKSYLPIDAVIMAGGRGSRLKPLTDNTPKPLLKVGDKPIIEHNIDRLCKFGIDDYWLSVRYLGEQLEAYFGTGEHKGVRIKYVWETEPLGTIGAVSKIKDWQHDYILITNSDLLTTLDYEDFFLDFLEKEADMAVATIPYAVDIPYAVMETSNHHVLSFKEKPTYTYYSNGGIYLMKKEVLERIPSNKFYNSTDLMQSLIEEGKKLISYPMRQYWLDIGKPEDFEKAQSDIKHLDL